MVLHGDCTRVAWQLLQRSAYLDTSIGKRLTLGVHPLMSCTDLNMSKPTCRFKLIHLHQLLEWYLLTGCKHVASPDASDCTSMSFALDMILYRQNVLKSLCVCQRCELGCCMSCPSCSNHPFAVEVGVILNTAAAAAALLTMLVLVSLYKAMD